MPRTFNKELKVRDYIIKVMKCETTSYMATERAKEPVFRKFLYEMSDLSKREIAFILGIRVNVIEKIAKKEKWKKAPKVRTLTMNEIQEIIIGGMYGIVPVKYETEEELRKRTAHILRVLSLTLENDIKLGKIYNKDHTAAVKKMQEAVNDCYQSQLEVYGYIDTKQKYELELKYKQLEIKVKELEDRNNHLIIENVSTFESALGLTGGEVVRMIENVLDNFIEKKEEKNKIVEGFKGQYTKLLGIKDVNEALPEVMVNEEGKIRRRERRKK